MAAGIKYWFIYTLTPFLRIMKYILTFKPLQVTNIQFSLQYFSWITHQDQENIRNDHQLKRLLIVKQILLVNTLGNI